MMTSAIKGIFTKLLLFRGTGRLGGVSRDRYEQNNSLSEITKQTSLLVEFSPVFPLFSFQITFIPLTVNPFFQASMYQQRYHFLPQAPQTKKKHTHTHTHTHTHRHTRLSSLRLWRTPQHRGRTPQHQESW